VSHNTQLSAPVGSGDEIVDYDLATGGIFPTTGKVGCSYLFISAANGTTPTPLFSGQQTMANSLPMVIASNQSAIPVSGTFWQATQPVSGTFWQATQPISAISLPLPGGAATAANQTTQITALNSILSTLEGTLTVSGSVAVTGTFWQTTQPVSIADGSAITIGSTTDSAATTDTGVFSLMAFVKRSLQRLTTLMSQLPGALTGGGNFKVALVESTATQAVSGTVAVTGTFWQTTQPVSGTVTANAGTNLNTSALALETGGNLATLAGTVIAGKVATVANAGTNLNTSLLALESGGNLATLAGGVTSSKYQVNVTNATIAVTGTFWQATQPVSGTVTANAGTNLNTSALALETGGNLATLAGGISGGKYQTTIATALPAGTNVLGHVIIDSGTITTVSAVTAITNALPAGTNVIGHVIVDSGTVTAITNALPAGTNVIGHVIVDSGTITTVSAVTAITNALPAGTNVIGHVIVDSGTITTVSAVTAITNALPAGTNSIGTVQLGNTPNTTPVLANPQDPAATTGTITAADAATTTVTNASGQSITTGAPTASSSVSCTLNGETVCTLMLSGTYNTTTTFERSMDGGTTWIPSAMEVVSIGTTITSLAESDNRATVLRASVGGVTQLRVRCTSYTSGTLNVRFQPGYGVANVPVGQFGAWTVQPGNTQNTTPWIVGTQAVTSGGYLNYSFLSTAAVQAANIKNSAGQVYGLHFFNINATPVYLRLYNQTTSPGTGDTVVYRATIPGNTAAAGFVVAFPDGYTFGTGIGIRVTASIADNDNTALAANTVMGDVLYK
jgi:hypothetical protein